MGSTHFFMHVHIVFSTKHRERLITPEIETRLYPFMGGIVRDEGGVLLTVGGMSDHVHLLVSWRPSGTVSDLVRHVKSRSSLWVNETFAGPKFGWQDGYSVFTVSQSQTATVRRYIDNQKQHHEGRLYEQELIALLRAHGIEYDLRYLFE